MDELFFKCAIIAVASAVFGLLVKESRGEWNAITSLAAIVLLSVIGVTMLQTALAAIKTLTERSGIESKYITAVFKCLGICFIVDISANICKTCGQAQVAAAIEGIGKISITLMAVPFALEVLDSIEVLLSAA